MDHQNFKRINKFLSETGYCSRRKADQLIQEGKVKINSNIALLGDKITEQDEVFVNDKIIFRPKKKKMVYLAFNKPQGIVSTTDSLREKNNILIAL